MRNLKLANLRTLVHDAPTRQGSFPLRPTSEDSTVRTKWKGELMKKIKRSSSRRGLNSVKDALLEIGVEGMTVTEVARHGRQKVTPRSTAAGIHCWIYCKGQDRNWCSRTKRVESAVEAILKARKTGKIGDGKIFCRPWVDAIRIRNDEHGESVLLDQRDKLRRDQDLIQNRTTFQKPCGPVSRACQFQGGMRSRKAQDTTGRFSTARVYTPTLQHCSKWRERNFKRAAGRISRFTT